MGEPAWVRHDVALAIHQRQLAEHGGDRGVRDEGLLASALAKPRNLLGYSDPPPDLPALAASYASGLARNHPFVDGNKRTALVVCRTFLNLNGCDIAASPREKYVTFFRLAKGQLSEEQLADWIRKHLRNVP